MNRRSFLGSVAAMAVGVQARSADLSSVVAVRSGVLYYNPPEALFEVNEFGRWEMVEILRPVDWDYLDWPSEV